MNDRLVAIAALSQNRIIGRGGQLPWYIPEDMQHFKSMTLGYSVIMGRKTYESLGKPLQGRLNIVLSQTLPLKMKGIQVARDINEALRISQGISAFIIGGEEIFNQTLHLCNRIFLTEVQMECEGDTYFPELDMTVWKECFRAERETQRGLQYHFVEYVKQWKLTGNH